MHDESRRSGRHPATLVTQVGTFVAIGVVSTAACLVLYGGLRGVLSVIGANALALFMTAIGNTAANRRQTFRVRGRRSMLHDQVAGMGAFARSLPHLESSGEVCSIHPSFVMDQDHLDLREGGLRFGNRGWRHLRCFNARAVGRRPKLSR